jgi:hypothetical protein
LLRKSQVLVTCYYLGTWGNTWVLVQVLGFGQSPKYLTSLNGDKNVCFLTFQTLLENVIMKL